MRAAAPRRPPRGRRPRGRGRPRAGRLTEPHQAAAEGQLLVAVPVARAHTEGAARRLREVHQLAQHGGAAGAGRGEAVLEGCDLPLVVLGLLREVGEELVEVGTVLLRRRRSRVTRRAHWTIFGRGGASTSMLSSPSIAMVKIVALGGLREVLEHPDGEVRLADLFQEVRHQEVAVDALGVRGQPRGGTRRSPRAHPESDSTPASNSAALSSPPGSSCRRISVARAWSGLPRSSWLIASCR